MKILSFLFLVYITYSNSEDIQNITMGDITPKLLRASKDTDYFYYSYNNSTTYNSAYLLLIDDLYYLKEIKYCLTSSYPSNTTIKECYFNSINYDDLKTKGARYFYYYRMPISSRDTYTIIKYSGKYQNGKFRAKSYFIEKVPIGSNYETELSTFDSSLYNNYFYVNIDYPSSNSLYFNFSIYDKDSFFPTIYYCQSKNNPEYNSPENICEYFSSLIYYAKKYTKYKNEYFYKIDPALDKGTYIIVKYDISYSYSDRLLYGKVTYNAPVEPPSPPSKSLSTLSIVFIAIGGVAFIGIIITIVWYFCRKKEVTSVNADCASTSYPDCSLVTENNTNPT